MSKVLASFGFCSFGHNIHHCGKFGRAMTEALPLRTMPFLENNTNRTLNQPVFGEHDYAKAEAQRLTHLHAEID